MSKRHASFPNKVTLQCRKITPTLLQKQKKPQLPNLTSSTNQIQQKQRPPKRKVTNSINYKIEQSSSFSSSSSSSFQLQNEDDPSPSQNIIKYQDVSSIEIISERSGSGSGRFDCGRARGQRGMLGSNGGDRGGGGGSGGGEENVGKRDFSTLLKSLVMEVKQQPLDQRKQKQNIKYQAQQIIQKEIIQKVKQQEQNPQKLLRKLTPSIPLTLPPPLPQISIAPQFSRIDQIVQDGNDKIKANDNYKPKIFSQPFHILRGMFVLQAHQRPTSMNLIDQKCRVMRGTPLRQLYSHMERLVKNNYVKIQDKSQKRIWLTTKGVKFIAPKMSLVEKGKESELGREKEEEAKSCEKDKKKQDSRDKNSNVKSQSEPKKDKKIIYFKTKLDEYPKQLLCSSKNAQKLKLIINELSLNLQGGAKQLEAKLQAEGSIKYQIDRINTNINFMWQVQKKILDCFACVIHHTKTDLQIIKHALSDSRICNSTKFIIILQRSTQQQLTGKDKKKDRDREKDREKIKKQEMRQALRKEQLDYFIFDCRAAGISVFKTENDEQTIFTLRKIGSLLSKKIRNIPETGESIKHYGPIQKLDEWFKISNQYILRRITIKCLKRIKYLNIPSIKRIAQKLPSLGSLFGKLVRLDTTSERIRFMKWLLDKSQSDPQAYHMIVSFFFLNDYSSFRNLDSSLDSLGRDSSKEKISSDIQQEEKQKYHQQIIRQKREANQPQKKVSQDSREAQKKDNPTFLSRPTIEQTIESKLNTSKSSSGEQEKYRKMYEYESDDEYKNRK